MSREEELVQVERVEKESRGVINAMIVKVVQGLVAAGLDVEDALAVVRRRVDDIEKLHAGAKSAQNKMQKGKQ